MPRDVFINRIQNMIDQGEFSHIGSAEVRVEGSTAWGVWARVSHWHGGLARHRRMRCGVLYHVANRSCTFHGSARDALQLLLPLFESRTFASMTDLPSVRTPGEAAEPLALDALSGSESGAETPAPLDQPPPVDPSSPQASPAVAGPLS